VALRCPPVVEDTALHSRVWLDAADEVARGAEQRRVEVLLGTQESLGDGRLQQGLGELNGWPTETETDFNKCLRRVQGRGGPVYRPGIF